MGPLKSLSRISSSPDDDKLSQIHNNIEQSFSTPCDLRKFVSKPISVGIVPVILVLTMDNEAVTG